VATDGSMTVAELRVPPPAVLVSSIRPYPMPDRTRRVRDDSAR
jgi:hypothetical protein